MNNRLAVLTNQQIRTGAKGLCRLNKRDSGSNPLSTAMPFCLLQILSQPSAGNRRGLINPTI
ncbi:hypothetical protein BABINDRAFT_161272 [Babjeviella inositovora NRRL Y-12698]|uniref:Uncharacterized protein n=1 Tax=Babjeviella inositovora NRRL Y-12698 TaxID=984486 RepID=A0A1E3QRJ1_9ASCO|nr:uncharacterized protein BABINDRAFT_161272 [Babjeviella inositovora NRRL Y-12698]ODQ80315.1 hypothetical protein BABINDRAFT_161272 [Babjeviella inositovora NRRL Y-12698]